MAATTPKWLFLDTKRKATTRNTTLHRAHCERIRKAKTKRTHWTTGGRMKACSELPGELIEWAHEQTGGEPKLCDVCDPTGDDLLAGMTTGHSAGDHPLTKLENDIVSAVVESAVIHLDNNLEYRLTVGDVARYLSKTPSQISVALLRLASRNMLKLERSKAIGGSLRASLRVFPTPSSLRTVPAFAEIDVDELHSELATLHR